MNDGLRTPSGQERASPTVTPTEARQGDRKMITSRVLVWSGAIILVLAVLAYLYFG